MDNKTFAEPEVPLSFTVNEAVSKIAYALDGKENVTVAGNTTLTGLAYGAHNLTVCAVDAAGNTGASETVTFTLSEPFPVTAVAVASTAVAAVICVSLVIYLTKMRRKQKPETPHQ
jgi:predicted phage tail protein